MSPLLIQSRNKPPYKSGYISIGLFLALVFGWMSSLELRTSACFIFSQIFWLPLDTKFKYPGICDPTVSKIKKRLSPWKKIYISDTRRLSLVSKVLPPTWEPITSLYFPFLLISLTGWNSCSVSSSGGLQWDEALKSVKVKIDLKA